MSRPSDPHLPAIRQAVAEVYVAVKLDGHARRCLKGELDGQIPMKAARLAVDRSIQEMVE